MTHDDLFKCSILPLQSVDEDNTVVETTVVDSIAGGVRETEGMPNDITITRLCRDGKCLNAKYELAVDSIRQSAMDQ